MAYVRKKQREQRYMVLHSIPVSCVTHESLSEPSCITRFEWRDRDTLSPDDLFVGKASKLNKTSGPYIPIKF